MVSWRYAEICQFMLMWWLESIDFHAQNRQAKLCWHEYISKPQKWYGACSQLSPLSIFSNSKVQRMSSSSAFSALLHLKYYEQGLRFVFSYLSLLLLYMAVCVCWLAAANIEQFARECCCSRYTMTLFCGALNLWVLCWSYKFNERKCY